MNPKPPVIIIGMHRSGTGLLTRMLHGLGVFIGWKKDPNQEALFFSRLNEWLFRSSGASWDHPSPIGNLLEDVELRRLSVDYIRILLNSPGTITFLGMGKYCRYKTPTGLDIPWGWKDPRNTYLLPIWLELFPQARVLHICRHGVDVSNSLKVRHEKELADAFARHERQKPFYWLKPKRSGFVSSSRCTSLEEGFALWEEYMRTGREKVEQLGNSAFELKYENLLKDPNHALNDLAGFLDLQVSQSLINQVARQARQERAYAYKKDLDLRNFADRMAERLRMFGY